jgi:hypothetical protein
MALSNFSYFSIEDGFRHTPVCRLSVPSKFAAILGFRHENTSDLRYQLKTNERIEINNGSLHCFYFVYDLVPFVRLFQTIVRTAINFRAGRNSPPVVAVVLI